MATRAFPGYQGVALGNFGAAAGGSGAVSGVTLSGWARQNTDQRPHGVANDYIASTLGMMLGLPIPPVSLISLGDEQVASVSLGFGERGVQPPPVDLEQLVADHPVEAAGILVFDHWVVNTDRHDENLASLKGHGMVAFDHDAALIGFKPPKDSIHNLTTAKTYIVQEHCLAPYLTNWKDIEEWVAVVRRMTKPSIRRVVQRAFGARLISAGERDAIVSLLVYRAQQINAMIENRASDFTRIAQSGLPGGEQS